MKVLFLTIIGVKNVSERGLYNDLMRKFRDNGHDVYIACPTERRNKTNTNLRVQDSIHVLSIRTLNFQKTNIIEKGLGSLMIGYQFLNAIKKYYAEVRFDVVIYATPPITFTDVIKYIKEKSQAMTYLLLKDIFPQNAVDLGMMKRHSMIHNYFKRKEKLLYSISDHIGCMSPANIDFVKVHNPYLDTNVLEINPNSIEPLENLIEVDAREAVRSKYAIPNEATAFIYGGNLGKPQGISFLIEILNSNINRHDCFFVVAGSGTEFPRIQDWFDTAKPLNAILLKSMKKPEYDLLLQSCDVGLIFLDPRFTIPNFPSRLLSYMECKMPILAATDINTDVGKIIEENKFGFWAESGDIKSFNDKVNRLIGNKDMIVEMGTKSYTFLIEHYTVDVSYNQIIKHLPQHV